MKIDTERLRVRIEVSEGLLNSWEKDNRGTFLLNQIAMMEVLLQLAESQLEPHIIEVGKQICPPWTDEQVERLNTHQKSRKTHPFTCGNDSRHKPLLAKSDGWYCENCDYRQYWAHAFMAYWEK